VSVGRKVEVKSKNQITGSIWLVIHANVETEKEHWEASSRSKTMDM